MYADQVTVAGQPDIALQTVGALVERPQVRAEGVLRKGVGPAAMGEDQRTVRRHNTRAGCPFSLTRSRLAAAQDCMPPSRLRTLSQPCPSRYDTT